MTEERLNSDQPTIGKDMSSSNGRLFKKKPAMNVISKEEFEERVGEVFELLGSTLAKSFGPFGAPTMIYNYPYEHVTKDGYTIFKSLSFDVSETLVDQCIADLAGDICGRINYTVGDGTTSAIIATNNVYKNYRKIKPELDDLFVLPRDILKMYEGIKTDVLEKLREKAIRIDSPNKEELRKNIRDVVYISSNGDDTYTDYISDLYAELGGPMITCRLAPDGVTKKILVEGYKFNLQLNDQIYINTDDKTMNLKNADVIMFNTAINIEIYEKIIKPLSEVCKLRGRKLVVAAPRYDDTAIKQVIGPDLLSENAREKTISIVLTTYRNTTSHFIRLAEDFAMMMNTTIIDRTLLDVIYTNLSVGKSIEEIFNVDTRNIPGMACLCVDPERHGFQYLKGLDEDKIFGDERGLIPYVNLPGFEMIAQPINLGYVKACSLASNINTQSSYFTDLCYDETRYNAVVREAEATLAETEAKYQKLGTFNLEVNQCMERLFSLKLKMGVIEVGADTEMSQKLIKDAVDDAIKAAASAYRNGVVLGCNTNLIQVMYKMYTEETNKVKQTLIKILLQGFIDVYRTVLGNAFDDYVLNMDDTLENLDTEIKDFLGKRNPDIYNNDFKSSIKHASELFDKDVTIHQVLVTHSILNNKVLNISTFDYNTDVINSVQTDEEILKAVIDLISILIVGNQMVVTQKHNFE